MTLGSMHFKDIFRNRHEPESLHALANLYWATLLIGCMALGILFVAYNIWVFVDVSGALPAPVSSHASQEKLPFDRAQLRMFAQIVQDHKARFDGAKSQAPVFADPSK